MSKVLITGSAGYIGSHTCLAMAEAGYDIVGMDNLSNSKMESVKRVRELAGKDFSFYECDIRDKDGLRAIFREQKITSVIHFAGLKAVGESCQVPLRYYENNVGGTISLLEVMDEMDARCMVFSSSATVYGDNIPPYREEMRTGGMTHAYGRTKFMIEEILKDLCASDSRWSAVLLRYFNPIGAHPSGRIGEDPNGIPNNLMPYVTQVAVGKMPFVRVFGGDYETHDGTGVRDYIHVMDLAEGHAKAVAYAEAHTGVEAVNLGTGVGYSVLDIIKAFEGACGHPVPYKIAERRAGDLPSFHADPEKAGKFLGFKAKRTLRDMCEDSWNWQKNNPEGYGG